MLAQQAPHCEDTTAALGAGPGDPAHLSHGPGTPIDGSPDVPIRHDLALTDDHRTVPSSGPPHAH